MKLKNLQPGDVLLRPEHSPLLFIRHQTDPKHGDLICVFRHLETGEELPYDEWILNAISERKDWSILERSSQVGHSGSVDSDEGSHELADHEKEISNMTQNLTSSTDVTTAAAETATVETKTKKTRTVDYTRTDKRPHSFRYKRHSTFVARSGAVSLSKDADGAFVIGPAPEGSTADAGTLEAGQLELVSVKKRPNGKCAIAFSHPDLGVVVAYDARSARAALRAG